MSHICADIADPAGFVLPSFCDTVQGYIGERVPIKTPTPHIWTAADWSRFKSVKKYPMFVGTPAINAPGDATTEAFECLEALYVNGFRQDSAVGLDMETAIDSAYVLRFAEVVNAFHYEVFVYGSLSTVFKNPECNGYDVADFTGVEHYAAAPGNSVRMTQYADAQQSGLGCDLRVIKPWTWTFRLNR